MSSLYQSELEFLENATSNQVVDEFLGYLRPVTQYLLASFVNSRKANSGPNSKHATFSTPTQIIQRSTQVGPGCLHGLDCIFV
jgi:hypothetical protein